MGDDATTELKKEINNLIWMHAPKGLSLEKAEDIACEILCMIVNGHTMEDRLVHNIRATDL